MIGDLTKTERRIFERLVHHIGKCVTKEELSEKGVLKKLAPFDRTVDVHIGNIRKKFIRENIEGTIKTIRGVGYAYVDN